ncbi:hypothetical protein [Nostoc sp. 'Peltigera membranacea cyanobiont' 213]|uniref:hypothetical protein n=1 Tax=Nostoc sp. 'Peltigera membranacea cyanobiont' 213 TaxID=2014530 RepID=UPI00167D5ED5|nr:hypothetical protein [Nostoc sp. 'Peltigera membranacea cyanobiont' 213]
MQKISKQSDRLAENLKNNAIACCGRVSAIALQKISKTKRRCVAACRDTYGKLH